jgi:hypothetical protein
MKAPKRFCLPGLWLKKREPAVPVFVDEKPQKEDAN